MKLKKKKQLHAYSFNFMYCVSFNFSTEILTGGNRGFYRLCTWANPADPLYLLKPTRPSVPAGFPALLGSANIPQGSHHGVQKAQGHRGCRALGQDSGHSASPSCLCSKEGAAAAGPAPIEPLCCSWIHPQGKGAPHVLFLPPWDGASLP